MVDNNNKIIIGLQLCSNNYLFYINQVNQIGNKVSNVRLIWNLEQPPFYFNLDIKVNSNHSLPFKCVYNGNRSSIDIILTEYLLEIKLNNIFFLMETFG